MSSEENESTELTNVVEFVRDKARDPITSSPSPPSLASSSSRRKVSAARKEMLQAKKGKEDKKRKQASSSDKSEKNDKKKKRIKKTPRCSSPSHFYVDPSEEQKYGPEFLQKLPGRHRVDNMLRTVATMFYRHKQVSEDGQTVVEVTNENDQFDNMTLDVLLSPLRKPGVLDNWSPKEIALFEAGVCTKGKDFHAIQKFIKTKTTNEIVDFYYNWKQSAHYQMWKSFGRPQQKLPSSRTSQWNAVNSKMKGFDKPRPKQQRSSSPTSSSSHLA